MIYSIKSLRQITEDSYGVFNLHMGGMAWGYSFILPVSPLPTRDLLLYNCFSQILYQLLVNVCHDAQSAAQSFYQTYFTEILTHVFSVVTDTSHSASLAHHAQILSYMFKVRNEYVAI